MDSEQLLPREHRLEMWFHEYEEEIQLELESFRSEDTGDLIIPSIDQMDVASAINLEAAASFLTQHVYALDERAYETVGRSFLFACQVASIIHHEGVGYDLNSYLQEVFEAEDPQQKLEIDVRGYYFADNPSVRNILRYYARDIDQYRGYERLVEPSGGMIFMLIERSLGRRFVHDEYPDYTVRSFGTNV